MGPKGQGAAAKAWPAARQAEPLPVQYYHVVFTLPAKVADIAYRNKAEIYGIPFKAAVPDALAHRRRPQASGRPHRDDRRPPHLGLGADPSPARPLSSCPVAASRPQQARRAQARQQFSKLVGSK